MNNLEKLIQFATIEQMYSMLEKLRLNNTTDFNNMNLNLNTETNKFEFEEEMKELKAEIHNMNNILKTNNDTINKLLIKIDELKEELDTMKNNTNTNINFLNQQVKGQQLTFQR